MKIHEMKWDRDPLQAYLTHPFDNVVIHKGGDNDRHPFGTSLIFGLQAARNKEDNYFEQIGAWTAPCGPYNPLPRLGCCLINFLAPDFKGSIMLEFI